jgi:hypothetical protein
MSKHQGRLTRTRLSLRAILQQMTPEELRTGLRNLQNSGHIIAYKAKQGKVSIYYWAGVADMETIMHDLLDNGGF